MPRLWQVVYLDPEVNRYRLVTRTTTAGKSETHVSSVVQTHAEAMDDMDMEESIASAAGWHTVRLEAFGTASPELVCTRGKTVRAITIRESGPFDDAV